MRGSRGPPATFARAQRNSYNITARCRCKVRDYRGSDAFPAIRSSSAFGQLTRSSVSTAMGRDMSPTADHVIETFEQAAEENLDEPLLRFQVINLPDHGELWMSGDLHDHRRNFDKLVRARPGQPPRPPPHPARADPWRPLRCRRLGEQLRMLFHAAELKCDFSNQVHFLANHDVAQIHGEGIMKAGLASAKLSRPASRRHSATSPTKSKSP